MIDLCAAFLNIGLPEGHAQRPGMHRCVSENGSELDIFFHDRQFERAVHRNIQRQDFAPTVVLPRDRAWFADRTVNGQNVKVIKVDLPDGTAVELWLNAKPIVRYFADGTLAGSQEFSCDPPLVRHLDELSGNQILF